MNRILTLISAGVIASAVSLQGCLESSPPPCTKQVDAISIASVNKTQLQKDIEAIDDYLAKNSITAIKDPSGLRYVITTPGDAARPCLEKSVLVKYTGKLMTTGAIFDSTFNNPNAANGVVFRLNGLILGWQIGFTQLGRGAKATFYIPSVFAYGAREIVDAGVVKIPANSSLIFDVELIDLEE